MNQLQKYICDQTRPDQTWAGKNVRKVTKEHKHVSYVLSGGVRPASQ